MSINSSDRNSRPTDHSGRSSLAPRAQMPDQRLAVRSMLFEIMLWLEPQTERLRLRHIASFSARVGVVRQAVGLLP